MSPIISSLSVNGLSSSSSSSGSSALGNTPFLTGTIAAVYNGASGNGTYNGYTNTSSQATYIHQLFTGSAYWEWYISTGFGSTSGFVGLMDATHYNAGPNFGGSSGERMMWYVGQGFSYGSATGTTLSGSSNTAVSIGDVLGLVYNNANGKLAYFLNGNYFLTLTNASTINQNKYPGVSMWTQNMGTNLYTTPTSYSSNYYLPT